MPLALFSTQNANKRSSPSFLITGMDAVLFQALHIVPPAAETIKILSARIIFDGTTQCGQ
jgi:hypothetical protein